ncbi:hypothetical protein BC939DRAFT_524972 [Gamsiella multidivaricata]|uniref:uncharacterized protein n=1 Tax=Gamsiella multidivaricata TaxID=101098 RepID=UPI00222003D7|nr:uncharacterized protein BC939DRAFT_524972 [Gamsiella multidivaricata]KAI7831390.1 hypothetical protein BC939DRAFT_524972 [Gamsiella multidivaricata]
MGASLIATAINFDTLFGALLVGASLILTMHSLARMIFLKRTASKYHLFPIINVAQFVNEICVFFLITAAFDTISFRTALWLNVINNVAYFITKPITMYLAYLRCSAVFPAFRKLNWLHYFLIGFRALELFVIVIVNIIQNQLCDGSVDKGTRCAPLAIAWTFRDAGAPVFRFYYIICEGIFYYKLFTTLKGMSSGKNIELMQYRRLQTSLFTVDLILLIFMSIYRIIGIFNTHLPTYVYYELFSSTLTIFTLTEFGLNIRMLFNSVSGDGRTNSDVVSDGLRGPDGMHSSKLEMGAVSSNRPRPLTNNSTSPLASNAAGFGNGSEIDISTSAHHQNYTLYGSHPHSNDWRYPFSANDPAVQFYDSVENLHEKQEPTQRPSLSFSIPERTPAVPDRTLTVPLRSSARHRLESGRR